MKAYQLLFYVPEYAKEKVKKALFAAGAGNDRNYDHCSWEVLGHGQFRPLSGSHPHIGQTNIIEQINEYRVEMRCAANCVHAVIEALMRHHPYEVPAYYLFLDVSTVLTTEQFE